MATTITVSEDFRERLKSECSKGETYEEKLRKELGWD